MSFFGGLIPAIGADFLEFSHVSFGGDIDLFNGLWIKIFVFEDKILNDNGIQD